MELAQALTFRYNSVAQEILCGPDTIAGLCSTLDRLAVDTALIVCGPSILHKSNVITRVQTALGRRCVGTFAEVLPHAPVPMLEEAVVMARKCQPQALVSVGGGSSHDTAKGIATLLGEGGRIHDYETRFTPPNTVVFPDFTQARIPVIAVSTTMGAAELSRGAGFTDRALGRKLSVADPGTIPRAILIDGQALATMLLT
jgi:alcohol dehydrogenase class IV